MRERDDKVQTPLFPLYSVIRHLVRVYEGTPKATVTRMIQDIRDQTGTPQNPVDWSNPDRWIPERLTGDSAALAQRIWQQSRGTVNPRHTYGSYLFINTHGLLRPDATGIYRLTERGRGFLDEDLATLRMLDDTEGMGELLAILATKTRAMRGDLIDEWFQFLRERSNFGTLTTAKDTLRRRLLNLEEREMVERSGNSWAITPKGIEYAAGFTGAAVGDPSRDLFHAIKGYNEAQLHSLREHLGNVPPVQFEHLVSDLLSAMGYEDVRVTQQSGDRGVDVVATVQFGITTITEVVQVKRHRGSIGRPILDQLRGALPYHHAQRGTIITLGTFSSGCKEAALFPGAAPITLIDGDRLLGLLVEHEVGVHKRQVALVELDEEYLRTVHGSQTADAGDKMDG